MDRINVYDHDDYEGTRTLAGWFDRDTATEWGEDTEFDGNNNISVNTRSQWEHEALYRTAGGRWVLSSWSQWQGSPPAKRVFISEDRARDWLLTNAHDEAAVEHFGPIESERGPGRPAVGQAINVRLGDELLAAVDNRAEQSGASRAETLRELVSAGLGIRLTTTAG